VTDDPRLPHLWQKNLLQRITKRLDSSIA